MDDLADGKRKVRADSLRNREQLIAAGKTAFTKRGADAPLEDIVGGGLSAKRSSHVFPPLS